MAGSGASRAHEMTTATRPPEPAAAPEPGRGGGGAAFRTHLARIGPFLPAVPVVAAWILWGHYHGGYFARSWYPGALGALALLVALVVARRRVLPASRPVALALGLLMGLVAWSYLSLLWSDTPGDGLTASNKFLLYLLSAWILALLPWTPRAAAVMLGAWVAGVTAVCSHQPAGRARHQRHRALLHRGALPRPDRLRQRSLGPPGDGALPGVRARLPPRDPGAAEAACPGGLGRPARVLAAAPEPRGADRPDPRDSAVRAARLRSAAARASGACPDRCHGARGRPGLRGVRRRDGGHAGHSEPAGGGSGARQGRECGAAHLAPGSRARRRAHAARPRGPAGPHRRGARPQGRGRGPGARGCGRRGARPREQRRHRRQGRRGLDDLQVGQGHAGPGGRAAHHRLRGPALRLLQGRLRGLRGEASGRDRVRRRTSAATRRNAHSRSRRATHTTSGCV